MKKSFIFALPIVWITGLQTALINNVFAAPSGSDWTWFFGQDNVRDDVVGAEGSADATIQILVWRVVTFLYIVAVLYGIWWGFNILTAGGDEEKVKKWKTILIQALIGLVVIFLASSIIQWLIGSILTATNA